MSLTHIVDGTAYPPDALVWRALCGASCFALDDETGGLVPPDFDFYLLGCGHEKASCAACKLAALSPVVKTEAVTA